MVEIKISGGGIAGNTISTGGQTLFDWGTDFDTLNIQEIKPHA